MKDDGTEAYIMEYLEHAGYEIEERNNDGSYLSPPQIYIEGAGYVSIYKVYTTMRVIELKRRLQE